jgi:hypothetical protein
MRVGAGVELCADEPLCGAARVMHGTSMCPATLEGYGGDANETPTSPFLQAGRSTAKDRANIKKFQASRTCGHRACLTRFLRHQPHAIAIGLSIALLVLAVPSETDLKPRAPSAGYVPSRSIPARLPAPRSRRPASNQMSRIGGTQQSVSIRNDANDVGLVHALGCLAPNAFGAASNPQYRKR